MAEAWRTASNDYAGDDNECMDALCVQAALTAALSVRGPSGTPAIVDLLMERIGWRDIFGNVHTSLDPSTTERPVFVVRTEETP